MAFNIEDVSDNQSDYTFKTDRSAYKITVYNTFRRWSRGAFALSISIVDSRGKRSEFDGREKFSPSSPSAVVSAFIALDKEGAWMPFPTPEAPDLSRRYITKALSAAWLSGDVKGDEDFRDPITGERNSASIKLLNLTEHLNRSTAAVNAEVLVTSGKTGGQMLKTVAFVVKREDGLWRIDDIGGNGVSFRSNLKFLALKKKVASDPAIQSATGPEAIVRTVIAYDRADWGTFFDDKPTASMRRYFTAGFNASWESAFTQGNADNEPVMDGDPITGYQNLSSVEIISVASHSESQNTAVIAAGVAVVVEGAKKTETITFSMKEENGGWKIDDITGGKHASSIRTYLRSASGG
jgi:hypothetical protein